MGDFFDIETTCWNSLYNLPKLKLIQNRRFPTLIKPKHNTPHIDLFLMIFFVLFSGEKEKTYNNKNHKTYWFYVFDEIGVFKRHFIF